MFPYQLSLWQFVLSIPMAIEAAHVSRHDVVEASRGFGVGVPSSRRAKTYCKCTGGYSIQCQKQLSGIMTVTVEVSCNILHPVHVFQSAVLVTGLSQ